MNRRILVLLISAMTITGLLYSINQKSHLFKVILSEKTDVSTSLVSPDAIVCPSSLNLEADTNCVAHVIVDVPTSVNVGSITCSITFLSYTLPNGTIDTLTQPYPATIDLGFWQVGNYQLFWNVTEVCSNGTTTSAICIPNINITEKKEPEIVCPADVSIGNIAGGAMQSGYTHVDIDKPTASDNCTADNLITFTHNSPYSSDPDDASGDYPLGTTVVCWTATDLSGNTAECCMSITVFDNTPPVITCPDTIKVTCSPPQSYPDLEAFILAGGTVTDDTALDSTSFKFIKDSIITQTCPNKVNIHRYYTIADTTGNRDTCFQTIFINDNVPPIAICKDITVNLEPTGMVSIDADSLDNGSSDNCGGPLTFTADRNLFFGCNDVAAGGQVTIVLTVTDVCGNSSTCTSVVTVRDITPPTISCPPSITVDVDAGVCYATNVGLGTPTVQDNCLIIDPLVSTLNGVPITGNTQFPLGVNTVIWTVTDLGGNTATCSQTITVEDLEKPTITCPPNITVNTNPGLCYATNVNLGIAVVTDNCSAGNPVATFNNVIVTSSTAFPVGSNTVVWTVTDASGNSATCSQTVTVQDREKPTITCPPNITVNSNPGVCYATNVNLGIALVTDNCSAGNPVATFHNATVTTSTAFPVGSNIVVWTVTDASGNTATCSQTITVQDLEKPTINCPGNIEVSLNENCNLTVPDLTKDVTVSDNCSIQRVVQSPAPGTFMVSSHGQLHIFTFTVTDNAGNTATCTATVTAKDKTGPNIVCKDPRFISIVDDPELPASGFIKEASDNCGGPLTYQVRRMGNICGGSTPDDFGNYVQFCCDDVNDTITIIIRVYDKYNNYTECMTSVVVQDKKPPVISTPLPDISVSCEYPLNLNDLSDFGTFVVRESDRQDIIISDPNSYYPPSGNAGKDGVYTDNCPDAVVTSSYRNALSMCKTGKIFRDFVITDKAGNTVTYTQTIYVIDADPMDVTDITWPKESVEVSDCSSSAPDPSLTGRPDINNDNCSMAAASYEDLSFDHPLYCKAIRRSWTVLDWCQYRKNEPNSPGKWTFVQNIYIKNTIPPVINPKVCRDTIICTGNGCTANSVTFNASGTDDCIPVIIRWKYKIDIDNNGGAPDYSGTGATVTKNYPIGKHKMTWEATDGCGNTAQCSFLFTVKDCKAPTPVAINGLAMNLMYPGIGTIWAKDFNRESSDNCIPANKLKYSFSSDINDTQRVFTCDSLGNRRIELWVTDLEGNQSMTVTNLHVQDNQNVCSSSGKIVIEGSVYTEEKASISDVKIVIEGGETEGNKMTKTDGTYAFDGLEMFNDYQLKPAKEDKPLTGITTLDLVMIQRHILGIETLKSPYKIIAADVNNSNSVTASDLTELRKMILGITDKFSKSDPWKFVDAHYAFENPENPWFFKDNLLYENVEHNMNASDFIAIKTGDVNGTVSADLSGQLQSRADVSTWMIVENTGLKSNILTDIPFSIDRNLSITGLQFTIELHNDIDFRGIEAEKLPLRQENIHYFTEKGRSFVNISFNTSQELTLKEGDVLFNVIALPKKNIISQDAIQISGNKLHAELYNSDLEILPLLLQFRNAASNQQTYLLQNKPNPFNEETVIELRQTMSDNITVTIYDAEGRMISSEIQNLPAGLNRITISNSQLKGRLGVFYCKIKSREFDQVIKLLRIE